MKFLPGFTASIVAPLLLVGCYSHIVAPGVKGKVVDAVTGKPVWQAEVSRPRMPIGMQSSSSLRFDSVVDARTYSAKNGSFDLPPKLLTDLIFYNDSRNPKEIHGSFPVGASGYEKNLIEGTATARSRWRVEAGLVHIVPLQTTNSEPGAPAPGIQPVRLEIDQTSSTAGSRR